MKSKKDLTSIGIDIAKKIFDPKPFKEYLSKAIDKSVSTVKDQAADISRKVGVGATRERKLADNGYKELLKTVRDDKTKNIEVNSDAEEVVLVVGGFAGKKGRSRATFAKQIEGMNPNSKS